MQLKDVEMAKKRILFFIGSLRVGGRERRLVELLKFLVKKEDVELLLVMTKEAIDFPDFYDLKIPYLILNKSYKKNDLSLFLKFYKVCKEFRPDIIHAWGRIQTLYTLPSIYLQRIPLVNSQIANAPPKMNNLFSASLIDRINFHFSTAILSNSKAGIKAYQPPKKKSQVIYNGIDLRRFSNLPNIVTIKEKYGIQTPYAVLMAASFSKNKDYDLFFKVAERTTSLRDDITFIGVGGTEGETYKRMLQLSQRHPRILFPGQIKDVEALVNACDIGVLFSKIGVHGEGISNAVLEYMSLAKPVVANDAGGTNEIVIHQKNGYLITNETVDEISNMIIDLIDDKEKYTSFANYSRGIIEASFGLEIMGKAFERVYQNVLKAS